MPLLKRKNTGAFMRFIPFAVTLVTLTVVLLAVNGYKYWRMKEDVAETVLLSVKSTEIKKLSNFLRDVEQKLRLVKGWGENGLLDLDDTDQLNRQLFPLLQDLTYFSGIILANEKGQEYYLSPNEKGYLVRKTRQKGGTAIFDYQLWDGLEKAGSTWQKAGKYSPVERPWFKDILADDVVSWTSLYRFYELKQDGVTASLRWRDPARKDGVMVCGIDVLSSTFEELLSGADAAMTGEFFLVNGRGEALVASGPDSKVLSRQPGREMVADYIANWLEDGRPSMSVTSIRYDKTKWLVSVQPLFHQGESLWFGVMVPEKELLAQLGRQWYEVGLLDAVVLLVVCGLLLIFFYKSGGWRDGGSRRLSPADRLSRYLKEGEGPKVEFKSTVRMNLQSGKHGKEIELAWLKAVVAFLNSNGGVLLIGVNDSGEVVGLEGDGFENDDRLLLHVKNLIHQHVGAQFAGLIETSVVSLDDDVALIVECHPSSEPVFLHIGKSEEFYIRSGPSSTKLSPSQMIGHVLRGRK